MKAKNLFSTLQKIGQCLMVPVSVLPAAGLMVACGRMILNASPDPGIGHALGQIFYSGGLAIFEQLPVVFAVGVAIGFTGGAGVAALAAVVGYFTLTNVLKVVGEARALELPINAGVFGGILIGFVSAQLYQRFSKVKLHPVLGFFSGKRCVPIVAAATAIVLGLVMGFVWPPIQSGIHAFGNFVMGAELGPAFYAAGKRLLIPVGLHHVYYPSFLFEFGEYVTQAGKVLHGESTRYFAGDPTAGRFMASEFPIMLFGLPAAALAMVLRAPKEKRKMIGGVMLSAALTSIITGITEPIEFSFIFVAPALFVFHVMAAFVSGMLTAHFDIHLGYTFSASAIDFGLGLFNAKNSAALFGIVGPLMALLYFGSFYWAIGKFNFMTPGREIDAQLADENVGATSSKAAWVLEALGGAGNIRAIDACITRLRLTVVDSARVSVSRLKELGAAGVLNAGQGHFQIVFGVESDLLKDEIRTLMDQKPTSGLSFLSSPIGGKVVSLEQVPDATFSQKILGDGVAIDPTEGVVYAPCDADVTQVFRTQHALGLTTSDGVELLIHVGLDTVKLNGEGFHACVKSGDKVTRGQRLLEFNMDSIRKSGKSLISPIVVTNMDHVKKMSRVGQGSVTKNDRLLEIQV